MGKCLLFPLYVHVYFTLPITEVLITLFYLSSPMLKLDCLLITDIRKGSKDNAKKTNPIIIITTTTYSLLYMHGIVEFSAVE